MPVSDQWICNTCESPCAGPGVCWKCKAAKPEQGQIELTEGEPMSRLDKFAAAALTGMISHSPSIMPNSGARDRAFKWAQLMVDGPSVEKSADGPGSAFVRPTNAIPPAPPPPPQPPLTEEHMPDTWPYGCKDKHSCSRHGACQYGCYHDGRDIKPEIIEAARIAEIEERARIEKQNP
jgi:hypothetical protein